MEHLWRRYPALRRAALAQGFLSIAFSAFWSTLAVMLLERYHLGSAVRWFWYCRCRRCVSCAARGVWRTNWAQEKSRSLVPFL
jgi:hypothetical protein